MKIKVLGGIEPNRKYPYAGIFENGAIVLFTEPKTGVVIDRGDGMSGLGTYATDWDEHRCRMFPGKVILTNY